MNSARSAGRFVGVVEDSDEDFEILCRAMAVVDLDVERWTRSEDLLQDASTRVVMPEFFLIDLNLIGTDGCELVRRLRQLGPTRTLPLIVLSGSDRRQDIDRCYAAGASLYLRKPLRAVQLAALLELIAPPAKNMSGQMS